MASASDDPPVTVAVSRRIKPGSEQAFEQFVTELSAVAMSFKGHLGANIFRPTYPGDNEYRIIFKFDHRSNYQRWLDSAARRQLMERSCQFLQQAPTLEVIDGLETWFTLPGQPSPGHPARYKMALVTWLALFPLVTLLLWLLGDWLASMPLVPRTALLTLLVVALMSWVVMPPMTRLFQRWLYKGREQGKEY